MPQSSLDVDNQLQLLHPETSQWVKAVALLQVAGGLGVRFTGLSNEQLSEIASDVSATKSYSQSLSLVDFDSLLKQIVSITGDVNGAAPSTDEGAAPLNGRLIRVAQLLTAVLGTVQTLPAKIDAVTAATNARTPAGTPTIISQTVGSGSETQFVLPVGAKKFFLKCRQGKTDAKDILYYSWKPNIALGQQGDTEGSFDTIPLGSVLAEESISITTNKSIFVCTKSVDNVAVVLGYWV